MKQKPVLIVGLGNPILGDDGIGWVVADRVRQVLGDKNPPAALFDPARRILPVSNVEIDRLSLGGLSLMERLHGYEHVILIDSITTGKRVRGHIWSFPMTALADFSGGHTSAPHDTSLMKALQVGRAVGVHLPDLENIHIVAIEIEPSLDFSEELSPSVAASVTDAVEAVLSALPIAEVV